MVRLLNQADWGEDRGRIQRLKGWVYYPLLQGVVAVSYTHLTLPTTSRV